MTQTMFWREARASARFAYGISCEVEHDDRTLRVDLPASEGGTATGPHPGQLLRASLGACLLMGYRKWADRLGVPLHDARVALACEYDERGQLGLDPEVFPGWQRLVMRVTLVSVAPEEDVLRMVDVAHRTSPMLANLSDRVERVFLVSVEAPAAAGVTERLVPREVTPSR